MFTMSNLEHRIREGGGEKDDPFINPLGRDNVLILCILPSGLGRFYY